MKQPCFKLCITPFFRYFAMFLIVSIALWGVLGFKTVLAWSTSTMQTSYNYATRSLYQDYTNENTPTSFVNCPDHKCFMFKVSSITGTTTALIKPQSDLGISDPYISNYAWHHNDIYTYLSTVASDGVYVLLPYESPFDAYQFLLVYSHVVTLSAFPLSPQGGINITATSTYANNPVYLSGSYINNGYYNQLDFDVNYDTYGQAIILDNVDIPSQSGIISWSRYLTLPYNGQYTAKIRLTHDTTGSTTAWSSPVTFNLTSSVTLAPVISTSTIDIGFMGTEICSSLFDISCNIKNVFIVLFQPSTNSVSQLVGYKTQIQNKPPFGYITILVNNLNNLSTTTATSSRPFDIVIPQGLRDLIFDPLKTGLTAILWLVSLVWLYNRLKHMQL